MANATLEKNQKYYISAIFNNTGNFSLNEDLSSVDEDIKSLVDGENIIGIVEGTFFVPNGFSRNDRFYPKELWTNQLVNEDVQRRLGGSTMFGCIGHSAGPVTEEDLSTGKVSHFMQKLWIDENTGLGMGRACILNTPAGKNLKTYLKAGCKLKVSSRGEGSFAEGVEKDGHPVVEASSYNLITFDFVIEPGFTETDPQLHENYIEESLIIREDNHKGDLNMEMEKIVEDYKAAKEQAEKNLQEQKETFETEKASMVESLEKANSELESCKKELSEVKRSVRLSESKTMRDRKRLDSLSSIVEDYKSLGTVDEIKSASVISQATLAELKAYKKLGKLGELAEMLENYETIISQLEAYKELGSVEHITRLYEASNRFIAKKKHDTLLAQSKEVSEKFGKTVEAALAMIEKNGYEKTISILTEEQTNTISESKVDTTVETITEEKQPVEEVSEAQLLAESIFDDYNSSMFISEEEKDEEEKEDKKKEEDKEEEPEEAEEDAEAENEPEDEEENEAPEDEIGELDDRVDSIQAQVDALATAFEQITGEDPFSAEEENEEPVDADYDFDIEDAEK